MRTGMVRFWRNELEKVLEFEFTHENMQEIYKSTVTLTGLYNSIEKALSNTYMTSEITKENFMTPHASLAEKYFISGCNCSQSVLCAFMDCTGLDYDTSMKLGSSFGGGFGRMREVCGAFSGACIVAGLLWGYSDVTVKQLKADHYALVQDMAARFNAQHGSLICRELLKGIESSTDSNPSDRTADYYQKRPCANIAATASAILDEIIAEREIAK